MREEKPHPGYINKLLPGLRFPFVRRALYTYFSLLFYSSLLYRTFSPFSPQISSSSLYIFLSTFLTSTFLLQLLGKYTLYRISTKHCMYLHITHAYTFSMNWRWPAAVKRRRFKYAYLKHLSSIDICNIVSILVHTAALLYYYT